MNIMINKSSLLFLKPELKVKILNPLGYKSLNCLGANGDFDFINNLSFVFRPKSFLAFLNFI